jgi:rubrerythrin
MSSTSENLQEAFAGESQANQKYRAFAKMAEKEGMSNIAKLFRTTAEAERIHAEGHLKALDHVGSTVENLQAAIDGETFEFTKMYPPMVEQAKADGHKGKTMFMFAVKAEAVHAEIYKKDIEAAKAAGCDVIRVDPETVATVSDHPRVRSLAEAADLICAG